MILSGLTPKSLPLMGRLALGGLAALLLPMIPTLAQDAPKVESSAPAIVEAKKDDGGVLIYTLVERDGATVLEATKAEISASKVEPVEVKASLRVAEVKVEASKEDQQALEKARAEARELEQQLGKARKRVAELEAKVAGVKRGEPMRLEVRRINPNDRNNSAQLRLFGRSNAQVEPHVIIKKDGEPANIAIVKRDGDGAPKVDFSLRHDGQDEKLRRIQSQLDDLQRAIKELKQSASEIPKAVSSDDLGQLRDQLKARTLEAVRASRVRIEKDAIDKAEKAVRSRLDQLEKDDRILQEKAKKDKDSAGNKSNSPERN